MGFRFNGWQAVIDQRARAEERQVRFDELHTLALLKDVAGYYRRYADYLKWDGIISRDRKDMHDMAVMVSSKLATPLDT